jgi:hypothetical protein
VRMISQSLLRFRISRYENFHLISNVFSEAGERLRSESGPAGDTYPGPRSRVSVNGLELRRKYSESCTALREGGAPWPVESRRPFPRAGKPLSEDHFILFPQGSQGCSFFKKKRQEEKMVFLFPLASHRLLFSIIYFLLPLAYCPPSAGLSVPSSPFFFRK